MTTILFSLAQVVEILKELGVPVHLTTLIKSLYETSEAVVKVDSTLSDRCHIRKSVLLGCVRFAL